MHANRRTLVIVNPVSAGGTTERRWPRIRDLLAASLPFDSAISEYAGHAIQLGKTGRDEGYDCLVCVGGDGTVNEVVNGALSGDARRPMPSIGLIPSGTGSDLARSLGIPHRMEEACRRLADPRATLSDLGVVSYVGREGPEHRYFVNAAGLGYDAEVVYRRNGFNRFVRGTIPYVASLAVTLFGYRNKDVRIALDGVSHARRISLLVVGIGRYFGGGMRIAPGAVLNDGYFDVITVGDAGRIELVRNLPGVYRGTHLQNPKVKCERAAEVRVETDDRLMVQADGDLLGLAPAQFQIVHRALTILY
ncbi:MAG: diacylglycerol/lipid kinase family protein [Sphingomonadaceae bacterium]